MGWGRGEALNYRGIEVLIWTRLGYLTPERRTIFNTWKWLNNDRSCRVLEAGMVNNNLRPCMVWPWQRPFLSPFLVAGGQIPMRVHRSPRRIASVAPLSTYWEEDMERGGRESIRLGVLPLMSLEVLGKSFHIPRPSFVICRIESVSSSPENTFVRIVYNIKYNIYIYYIIT